MARITYDGAKGPPEGRLYYAQRAGLEAPKLQLDDVRATVSSLYEGLEGAGWFQEWFGYYCVDDHDVPGKAGSDRGAFLHVRLFVRGLWPLRDSLAQAEETTLFSVIELLYDCVSQPLTGRFHEWNNCGWHYEAFNGPAGKARWRATERRRRARRPVKI